MAMSMYDAVPLDMGKDYAQADSFSANMAIYDRVEVLKGAAGMLKGAGTASWRPGAASAGKGRTGRRTPGSACTRR